MTGGQSYKERVPAPALAPYASAVWIQQVDAAAEPYARRTVPNGSVEIACVLGDLPRVAGPRTRPTAAVLSPGTTVVGVRLHPGAAAAVLGLPASEIVDLSLDAADLWGRDAVALGERLAAAATPDAATAVLERAITERVAGRALDPLVNAAIRRLAPGDEAEVASLSSSLYISERQLRRRTLAAVGLAPKTLQRMLRFQRFLALSHAAGHTRADIAALAAAAGYADQPHLTRESLRLAGMTPAALLRDTEAHCAGRHDHSASFAPLLRAWCPT